MMVATIDATKGFEVKQIQPLFRTGLVSTQNNHPYVVTRDGQRFLYPVAEETSRSDQITVVVNWTNEWN